MSIYRKYRPKKFADVLGQENVVQTLRGALLSGHVGHAYIFSGIRGTGKTSIARIFARAVNCLDPNENEPCGTCDICKEIDFGSFLDLIEIDAASNRGIEDIRDLREKVRFSPNRGKYKIYIIDEVHMLTNEAFNALLKTLEEPPAHAIFILATTEIHKIPQTILSRCQRLDFGKIGNEKMVDGIKKISESEGIKIDDKSAKKIAILSEGSVRDAFSYLDQINSFAGGGEIDVKTLESVLGISSEERLLEFLELVHGGNSESLVRHISTLAGEGLNLENFIKDMIRFLRLVMMSNITEGASDFLDQARAEEISKKFSFNEIVDLTETLNTISKEVKNHFIPQLPLEIGLVRYISSRNRKGEPQVIVRAKVVSAPAVIAQEEKAVQAESADVVSSEPAVPATNDKTRGFVERLKDKKVVLYSIIRNCEIIDEENNIVVCTNNGFYYDTINKRENLDSIQEILKEAGVEKGVLVRKGEAKKERGGIINSALSVFGGEIID